MLYEAYAEVLSHSFPCGFYKAGSDEADAVKAIPAQDSIDGYEVELSETLGNVTVVSNPADEDKRRERVYHLASAPDAYALEPGYLAVASAQQVYVVDIVNGHSPVELHYCYRDIAELRFDAEGCICATTGAGDVYVWENPVAAIKDSGAPAGPEGELSPECLSSDGAFKVQGGADGSLVVCDVAKDCVIWRCGAITEPISRVDLDEGGWVIHAVGLSGTSYSVDASDVLGSYAADDTAKQLENYRALGNSIVDRLVNELQIAQG